MDHFHDEAGANINPSRDFTEDFEGDSSEFDSENLASNRKRRSELNSARRRFIPIEFAKQHI